MRAMVLERQREPLRLAELPDPEPASARFCSHPLEAANEALDSIRDGSLRGAAVLRLAK
jgi:hypothetical protein